MSEFTKPALNISQQVELLRKRGLKIDNAEEAEFYLEFIGYYRLSGYMLPFQVNQNHQFKDGTTFSQILDRYIFDRKLRTLVFDVLERLEVAVRTIISNTLSAKFGPHWYMKPETFHRNFDHGSFIARLTREVQESHQAFIKHYRTKYCTPKLPPSWMVFEILSFGSVSKILRNLNPSDKKDVAQKFTLDHTILQSWTHSITYLRNLCAHHSRLWNRKYTIKPKRAKAIKNHLRKLDTFYAQAVIIQFLIQRITRHSDWVRRLNTLLAEHPLINPADMGFPEGWNKDFFWQ